jgi:hypothetical protein
MGHHEHHPVEINPQTLAESRHTWAFFTKGMVAVVVGVAVILSGMAFFLLG